MESIQLQIEGMHCGACVRRVTQALEALPGIRLESVEVGSARLQYDAALIARERIPAAIDGIGFPARIAD